MVDEMTLERAKKLELPRKFQALVRGWSPPLEDGLHFSCFFARPKSAVLLRFC